MGAASCGATFAVRHMEHTLTTIGGQPDDRTNLERPR
jgi:hypothetical protein